MTQLAYPGVEIVLKRHIKTKSKITSEAIHENTIAD